MDYPTPETALSFLARRGFRGRLLPRCPLGPRTTWKIGGPASCLAVPLDLEDVYCALRLTQEQGWPLFFLGRGSNVLIDDAGLPGVTLHLAGGLQDLALKGGVLRVGAGAALPRLAAAAARWGLTGFEFLAGIPGTVGAAVRLNAGAEGRDLAAALRRVWVATPQLQLLEFSPAQLAFGYRTSLLRHFPHWLVVGAELAPQGEAAPAAVRSRMQELLAARKVRQPANPRNCGSVFKNPPGGPAAGRLIELAGLKGRRRGGAQVSRKHANFILNQGGATAAQVKGLAAEIQERVRLAHGVALEREVVFLPDDLNGPTASGTTGKTT